MWILHTIQYIYAFVQYSSTHLLGTGEKMDQVGETTILRGVVLLPGKAGP